LREGRRTAAARLEVLKMTLVWQRVVVSWAQVLAWTTQQVMGWVVAMMVLVLAREVQRAEVMMVVMG
jgi:hypothetical protein